MQVLSCNVGEIEGGALERYTEYTSPLDSRVNDWLNSLPGALCEYVPFSVLGDVPDIRIKSVKWLLGESVGKMRLISYPARCAPGRPSVIMGLQSSDFEQFVRDWLAYPVRSHLKEMPTKYSVTDSVRADPIGWQLACLFAFDCLMHKAVHATDESRGLYKAALEDHAAMQSTSIHEVFHRILHLDAYLLSEVDLTHTEPSYPGYRAVLPKVRTKQSQLIMVNCGVEIVSVVIDDGALLCVQVIKEGRPFMLAAFHGLSEGTDTVPQPSGQST